MSGKRAAISVVEREGLILCVWNRRYSAWGLPGGKVDDGETVEEAQARELEEETGLRTIEATPICVELWDESGRLVHFFSVRAGGEPRTVEPGSPISWMTHEAFLATSSFAAFCAPMFEKLAKKSGGH